MSNFVLGFAFDVKTGGVVLIRKTHPEWQAGKLNGIGGRIEPGEQPLQAMVREFEEETGVTTDPTQWRKAGMMRNSTAEGIIKKNLWCVHVYTMREALAGRVHTRTEEQVEMFNPMFVEAGSIFGECLPNIPTLLQLCTMPKDHTGVVPHFHLVY